MEKDTVKLLEACNEGIKMGVDSIAEVIDRVEDDTLRKRLEKSKEEHQQLGSETHAYLNRCGRPTDSPNPIAQSMSFIKTEVKLAADCSDKTIAGLMTDGCNMGIKSLSEIKNRYPEADGKAVELTNRVIRMEETLAQDLRSYL